MNNIKAYPWVSAVISGIVGLLVGVIISNYVSYFPYSHESIKWGDVFWLGADIGVIVAWIVVIWLSIEAGAEEGIFTRIFEGVMGFFIYSILGIIIGGIIALIIVALAPIFLGIALAIVAGILLSIANGKIVKFSDLGDYDDFHFILLSVSIIIGVILSAIGWGLGEEIFINIFFIPIIATIGYEIGKTLSKMEEKRVEEKRKLDIYKGKIEQWKRESYNVSELEEMLK